MPKEFRLLLDPQSTRAETEELMSKGRTRMAAYRYHIVNVFTQEFGTFTGNPLCVFESADSLDAVTMQALALQFNLSETTFILRSERANARVRIFTPRYEMAFAGHPTLGTAHICRALGLAGDSLVLEMPAGLISVGASGPRWTLQANAPQWREVGVPREELARLLGVERRELRDRPLWVSTGTEQLIVPLTSEEAVARATLRMQSATRLQNDRGAAMAYVFAQTGGTVVARFFFEQGSSVLEDPATGSATANLGGWFIAMNQSPSVSLRIAQGERVGRPSTLYLDVDTARKIRVGGDVLELGGGTVHV
jgi:trans-2,3-dihydro-3-hydroxyanthranilate isomerase